MKQEKHQTVPEISSEQNISSTAFTLQKFRKEAEKKEAAEEAAKVRCRVCFKEIAPTPRCFGHGGGGGSGGGGGAKSEDEADQEKDESLLTADELVSERDNLARELTALEGRGGFYSEADEQRFDPDVIADLVIQGLLVINNDRESLTLSINLQSDPKLLSEEQRIELKKFLEAIIKEFNTFQEQHHFSTDLLNIVQDEAGNIRSLHIALPTLVLYDAFIQQLANNLLPTIAFKFQTKEELQKTTCFAPTPLSMEPKLSNEKTEAETQERELFNPTPYADQMKPW